MAVKKTAILIQSQLGGTITPEEVLKRIPEGCEIDVEVMNVVLVNGEKVQK